MRTLTFIIFAAIGSNLLAQTDSIEKAVLYEKLSSRKMEDSEFSRIWKQWNLKIKSDKYPAQPMDQNGNVHYIFFKYFKGCNAEYLFNRTLEWLVINYGLLPGNVYSNSKDGKIIYNLSLSLRTDYSCIPTAIISVKDEKIRFEFINIAYQVFLAGNYAEGIPERTVNMSVYPIILKKPNEWELNFSLLRETGNVFNSEFEKLTNYISGYERSFTF
ncbi:MAG: hypothetical protein ACM3NR_01240 [Methanosarcina sp.]